MISQVAIHRIVGSGGGGLAIRLARKALDAEQQAALKAERDTALGTAWVLTDATGGLIDLDNLRRRFWYPLLAAAKLKRYRLHDLRHTYTSRLLSRGANVKFIQQQLGHASLKMTLDLLTPVAWRARRARDDP